MTAQDCDQGLANHARKKSVHWRRDPIILARLVDVERRHLSGEPNVHIAIALSVTESTIRNDLARLNELWLERVSGEQGELRARAVRELDDIKRRALDAAAWDQACEKAVLFGLIDVAVLGEDVDRVMRDEKGSAQYRGQKASSINTARQAVMDQAKILGLVVEKQETKLDAAEAFLQALREFGSATPA